MGEASDYRRRSRHPAAVSPPNPSSITLAGSGVATEPPLLPELPEFPLLPELPPVFPDGVVTGVVVVVSVPGPSPTTHHPLLGTVTFVEPSAVPVGLVTATERTSDPFAAGLVRESDNRSAFVGIVPPPCGAPDAWVPPANRGNAEDGNDDPVGDKVAKPSVVGTRTGVPAPVKNVLPPPVEA